MSAPPRSILKRRLADLDPIKADLSLRRQIRALKRNELSRKLFSSDEESSSKAEVLDALGSFEASDSHFFKGVVQHPERDMENKVRVIDQKEDLSSTPRRPLNISRSCSQRKSTLPGLDLATRTAYKATSNKSGRRCAFNDTVEVYYYPENKEQHEHHLSDDFDDEDEEQLRSDAPQLSSTAPD